ncbi:hypothetical protein HWC14_gp50 [Serratia phage Parlo]|uniref:Uncharacterized protein n=1 Tax=Serratia phage Parlo TaxID=2557554 RepID=A0A482MG68_9CAUD|nr:hypothetical protein HWC14_gp50 [Serratia phage Parlo]QBQ72199.1 hypothetical protein CPT_Parlo_050 [Serratia phage Parlo]
MKMVYDDEAAKAGNHVRIEFNDKRTEIQIGTTGGSKLGFLNSFPLFIIDRERVKSQRDLATAVDYYAKIHRVSSNTTASHAVMRVFRLNFGNTIKGEI